ncbi:MAG: hypothetical protein U0271_28675 [Polyangiaceae bacterium]
MTTAAPNAATIPTDPCAADEPEPVSRDVRVLEDGGHIYLCKGSVLEAQLTDTGKDSAPELSPNGARVTFLRDRGRVVHPVYDVEVSDNRVMIMELGSRQFREVAHNDVCWSLWRPAFADDHHVMFTARGSEFPHYTHSAICIVDVDAPGLKTIKVETGTNCARFLGHGRFAGKLYVDGFHDHQGPGEYWEIVDMNGRLVAEKELTLTPLLPGGTPDRMTGDYCDVQSVFDPRAP